MLMRNIGYKDTVRVMLNCFLLTINVYFQSVMKTQNHIKFKNDLRCEKQTLRGLSITFINQYWPWIRFQNKINREKLVLSFDWILLLCKKKLNPGIAYFNSRICKLFQLLMYLTAKVFYS